MYYTDVGYIKLKCWNLYYIYLQKNIVASNLKLL